MRILSTALLMILCFGSFVAMAQSDRERRLNTVVTTTLPPDRGMLHVNPFVIRPANFERPGYDEVELLFIPVDPIGDTVQPILDDQYRESFSLTANLPERDSAPFEDTPRDYRTQEIVLTRGYYVLSEIAFKQTTPGQEVRDAYCLDGSTFRFEVRGRDTIHMGLLEVDYPTGVVGANASFNPAKTILTDLDRINGWRWTTISLNHFLISPTDFVRSTAFCSPDSISPSQTYRDES